MVRNTDYLEGYIDKTGKEVIPCQYEAAAAFSEGLGSVFVGDFPGGRVGFVDKTGQMVIPAKYGDGSSTATFTFSEGLAGVMGAGQYYTQGYIDKTGQVVIPFEYREVRPFSEGVAPVAIGAARVGSKWGYIDKTGTLVIPAKYDDARSLSEGMAAVAVGTNSRDYKWGFVCLGDAPVYEAGQSQATVAPESDFVIENGVLTKYVGPGGNIVIPSGATSIGKEAFLQCGDLTG